ncbi:MAG: M23 family metallopeptidase [Treponema sp.]|nr:M23 family metallopeptidase [Treponema sp.]
MLKFFWLTFFCLFILPLSPPRIIAGAGAEPSRENTRQGEGGSGTAAFRGNGGPAIDPYDPVQISPPPLSPAPEKGPRFAAFPENLLPGEPLTVAYSDDFSGPGSKDFRAVLIDSGGRRLAKAAFFDFTLDEAGQTVKAAILSVPRSAPGEPMTIRIEAANRVIKDLPVLVGKRAFISETIALDEKNTEIRTAPDPKKTGEAEQLWAILSRTGPDIFSGALFTPPVTSTRRTGFFGDRRVFQYVDGSSETSIHTGIDYGVPKGAAVRACASGKVVLARSRIVTGNSVVLEHLPGVYSLYYHLDSIEVSKGDIVDAGVLLGLSGATGLATGPHLHWEIRVSGEYSDPDAFMRRAVLDKDEILSNLKLY